MKRWLSLAQIQIEMITRPLVNAMDDQLWSQLDDEERRRFDRITHPRRKVEYSEGRRCLRELDPTHLRQSLSHSSDNENGLAVAVGTADPRARGIGVDAESATRTLSQSAREWLFHPQEYQLGLKPLTVWMIKEACFKADPDQQEGFTLREYEVVSGTEMVGTAKALKGAPRSFHYLIIDESPWRVAVAVSLI